MDYIHIKNLEKYHPGYKDRDLKWFKCYFKMVNADPEFEMLCEIDKWRFVALIMLELQYQKPIPLDDNYFKRKGFDIKKRSMSLTVQMLQESVEVVTGDSESCSVSVTQNKIREDKEKEGDKRFVPPSVEEVEKYSTSIEYSINGVKFVNSYQQKGWMVGKNKMVDWKAAVVNWKTNGWGKKVKGSRTIEELRAERELE